MAKRKRTPQAPPAAAGRRKKAREMPEEASGAGPSQPPRSRPKKGVRRGGPKEPVDPRKSLVVRPGDCLVGFLEGLQKRCQIIIWSRLSYKPLMTYLETLVMRRYLPEFLLDPQACTVWGGDRVEVVVPRNNLDKNVKLKGFRRLHDHGICTREEFTEPSILWDLSQRVDSFSSASLAVEWLTRFTHWLMTWTENVLPTVDFVHAHQRNMDGIFQPMMVLRQFWGETPQPNDRFIIWSDVPAATREILLTEWPHFRSCPDRVIEEAQAEEAPPVEEVAATRVKGAPVEKAPPVEEVAATRVEGAPVEEAPGQETTPVEEIPVGIPIPAEAIPLGAIQE
ncbi:hypothetical protein R1sor_007870 [Riccia sorocarpa]|uniref:Uncharacterized protein n=1 Tax=Riccia sorocarpa TaxID=122646 RepID=A0ABD3HY12_9MARC